MAEPNQAKYVFVPVIDVENRGLSPTFRSADPNAEPLLAEAASFVMAHPYATAGMVAVPVGAGGYYLYNKYYRERTSEELQKMKEDEEKKKQEAEKKIAELEKKIIQR